jgi:hypothetical protein
MPRDLPLLKEKFVMISFRSVADFKKHLLSAHKDAEKICIYDGCNWSCSKQATYKECLCATQKLTLKNIHLWKKDYCLGSVLSIILMGNFNLQLIIRTEKSKLRRSTGKKVANKF